LQNVSEDEGQPASQAPEVLPQAADAPVADQRPMKLCPDCAELVLKAARKCRYCGYEFRPPAPPPPAPAGLFNFSLRRSAPKLTMTETVAQLGIDLDPGEEPAGLWLARAYSVDGYVVLTDERLFFVTGLRRLPGSPPPRQHSLGELAGAEIQSRHFKSELVLHWHDSPDMTLGGMAPKDLRQLRSTLRATLERGRLT
jgi:hypothetical protein